MGGAEKFYLLLCSRKKFVKLQNDKV